MSGSDQSALCEESQPDGHPHPPSHSPCPHAWKTRQQRGGCQDICDRALFALSEALLRMFQAKTAMGLGCKSRVRLFEELYVGQMRIGLWK